MQKKVIFFLSAVPPWHLRPLLSSGHISPAVLFYSSPVPASSPPPPPPIYWRPELVCWRQLLAIDHSY